MSPLGGDPAPHLSRLPPHNQAPLVFTFSFSSHCCFSVMQAPNGLRYIKLTAFSKAVQFPDM